MFDVVVSLRNADDPMINGHVADENRRRGTAFAPRTSESSRPWSRASVASLGPERAGSSTRCGFDAHCAVISNTSITVACGKRCGYLGWFVDVIDALSPPSWIRECGDPHVDLDRRYRGLHSRRSARHASLKSRSGFIASLSKISLTSRKLLFGAR